MEKAEYRNIYEHEEKHFFYMATHRLVLGLAEKWLHGRRGLTILDAGCGTGLLAKKLEALGDVMAVDYSEEALRLAKKRGVKVRKASVTKLPFVDKSFDLVTCIDVIYHRWVKDDVAALRELKRVLKPRGVLILRVPANSWLTTGHDRRVCTARRYSKDELLNKLRRARLKTKQISFVHSLLLPLSLLRKLSEKVINSGASGVATVPAWLNKLLTAILIGEARLIVKGVEIPLGQGLVVVADPP